MDGELSDLPAGKRFFDLVRRAAVVPVVFHVLSKRRRDSRLDVTVRNVTADVFVFT